MSSPICLVLGAGPRVGKSVALSFANAGYKVAVAGRTLTAFESENSADLLIKADLSDPGSVKSIFEEVKSKLGVPNVIVYNAAAASFSLDPFTSGVDLFAKHLTINVTSLYAAALEAVAGFDTLPTTAPRTFIYTGNHLPWRPAAFYTDLGVGKAGGAHLIEILSKTFIEKGYQFYFGDERKADGSAKSQELSGEIHGRFYLELARREVQGPWKATFVGDEYVHFEK